MKKGPDTIQRAVLAEAIQAENQKDDKVEEIQRLLEEHWKTTPLRTILMVVSTHVDDLKGGANKPVAESLLNHMAKTVGDCTQEWNVFPHTGVQHEHSPGTHWAHQKPYISQLRPIDNTKLKGRNEDEEVEGELHEAYRSLLGGIAWVVLTRAEEATYVQRYNVLLIDLVLPSASALILSSSIYADSHPACSTKPCHTR